MANFRMWAYPYEASNQGIQMKVIAFWYNLGANINAKNYLSIGMTQSMFDNGDSTIVDFYRRNIIDYAEGCNYASAYWRTEYSSNNFELGRTYSLYGYAQDKQDALYWNFNNGLPIKLTVEPMSISYEVGEDCIDMTFKNIPVAHNTRNYEEIGVCAADSLPDTASGIMPYSTWYCAPVSAAETKRTCSFRIDGLKPGKTYSFFPYVKMYTDTSYSYLRAWHKAITVTTGVKRPDKFKWLTCCDADGHKVTTENAVLSAEEWKLLQKNTNAVREYMGLSYKTFTAAYPNEIFTSELYNEVGNAVKDITGYGTYIPTVQKGDVITASQFNLMMDELNAVDK